MDLFKQNEAYFRIILKLRYFIVYYVYYLLYYWVGPVVFYNLIFF